MCCRRICGRDVFFPIPRGCERYNANLWDVRPDECSFDGCHGLPGYSRSQPADDRLVSIRAEGGFIAISGDVSDAAHPRYRVVVVAGWSQSTVADRPGVFVRADGSLGDDQSAGSARPGLALQCDAARLGKENPRRKAGILYRSSVSLSSFCAASSSRRLPSRGRIGRAWRARGQMRLGR